ncbi:hypothetical protein SESBI_16995 [Sesbania bispinosa]|nr:hypothetical protein SESBI_16995 [Sesbania bispinosa]
MKKRKISQIDPNDPFIQTRALFHGAPNSEFPITKIDRQRKVKFAAPEKDSPKTCRLKQDSHMPSEREKVTTCADTDPKTSEFAFFKKLKKDANLRFRPRPLQKDACLSPKKPESGDYSRGWFNLKVKKKFVYFLVDSTEERTNDHNDVRVGSEGYKYNSSRIIEDVSTVKTDSFLSPYGGAWNKSDLYSIRSMPKNSQGCGDTFKPQGNQYMHGEIFSRKRQKLRQCVADALFTATDKLCSERLDIVSMLLSRLFPINIMENKYEDQNPGEVENDTKYDLLDSQEPTVQFKKHYQMPERKLHELDSSPNFSDQLLSPMFLRSYEKITPRAKFPTYRSDNFQPLYNKTAPECKLSRTPSFSASVKSDVTLGSLFNEAANTNRYDLLDSRELDVEFTEQHQIPRRKLLELESSSNFSDHLLSPLFLRSVELITPHTNFPTYLHKFQPQFSKIEDEIKFGGTPSFFDKNDVTRGFLHNEQKHEEALPLNHFMESRKLGREPIPLLLEKDYDCTTDEINLPITKYTKPDISSALSILGHGEEQILNKTSDEYHFSPSSLLLDKPRDFNSILNSGLLRYQEFRFGKYVYQDSEDMDRVFNHTALSLSHKKRYFKLSENCKDDISCVQDSLYLSPYQHWVGRTVSNDYHHGTDTEAWLQSSLDECQRCLSLTSSHWNYQSPDSRTLQLPQRESMSSLLCTNDNYEPEMDGGNHGEALYHFREGLIEIYNSSFLRLSMQRDNGCPFPLDDSDYINEQEQTHKMLL